MSFSVNSSNPLFHVALIEPEIPNNTGNIGRTCVGLQSMLHLVEPLGFQIENKHLKRAGLDYWPHLQREHHPSFENWFETLEKPNRAFFFTTKTDRPYYDIDFQEGDTLVFGRETKGLGPEILERFPTQLVNIPMVGPIRSLNLATAVAIGLYEAFRQVSSEKRSRL